MRKDSSKIKIPTFLKWAGGKRSIINKLDNYFPNNIINYYEPFLGAGSVFFYIYQKYSPKNCEISDINKDLIETYKAVQIKPKLVIRYLKYYFKKNNSEDFFYQVRKKFNTNKFRGVKRAAAFIYLNKTCFNGLYRVNKKGEFNVPYGKYKSPEIVNENKLLFASELLKGVRIIHQDYKEILKSLKRGDFVYLDPCYDPLKKTSFTQYTKESFTFDERLNLLAFMKELKKKSVTVVLSNNKLPEIIKLYEPEGFNIVEIKAPRFINSNPNGRGEIEELLIMC